MNMQFCSECGAPLIKEGKCEAYLEKMIAWDFADFTGVGKVHHLTVLCYYLQHPSHYSFQGLEKAKMFLKGIIENSISLQQLYRIESDSFSSTKRTWKVTGTLKNHGFYPSKINWSMTAYDVVKSGIEEYPQHVHEWAQSIYHNLIASQNM